MLCIRLQSDSLRKRNKSNIKHLSQVACHPTELFQQRRSEVLWKDLKVNVTETVLGKLTTESGICLAISLCVWMTNRPLGKTGLYYLQVS